MGARATAACLPIPHCKTGSWMGSQRERPVLGHALQGARGGEPEEGRPQKSQRTKVPPQTGGAREAHAPVPAARYDLNCPGRGCPRPASPKGLKNQRAAQRGEGTQGAGLGKVEDASGPPGSRPPLGPRTPGPGCITSPAFESSQKPERIPGSQGRHPPPLPSSWVLQVVADPRSHPRPQPAVPVFIAVPPKPLHFRKASSPYPGFGTPRTCSGARPGPGEGAASLSGAAVREKAKVPLFVNFLPPLAASFPSPRPRPSRSPSLSL